MKKFRILLCVIICSLFLLTSCEGSGVGYAPVSVAGKTITIRDVSDNYHRHTIYFYSNTSATVTKEYGISCEKKCRSVQYKKTGNSTATLHIEIKKENEYVSQHDYDLIFRSANEGIANGAFYKFTLF